MSLKLEDYIIKKRLTKEHLRLDVGAIHQSIDTLIRLIYPLQTSSKKLSPTKIKSLLKKVDKTFTEAFTALNINPQIKSQFFQQIPTICDMLDKDAEAAFEGDPAASSVTEVIISYPGFYALCIHRLAHALYQLDVPLLPRVMSEYAHQKTGIDIHPGAQIGEYCFIDHGTGVVVGETSIIGHHVKIYQGVTLGALSVKKRLQKKKRHPTIGDNCVLYANSTILGGETVVGEKSIIGGNVWLTESVPAESVILHHDKSSQGKK